MPQAYEAGNLQVLGKKCLKFFSRKAVVKQIAFPEIKTLDNVYLLPKIIYPKALAGFPSLCGVINETLKTKNTVRRSEISILHANTPLIIGYSTLLIKDNAGGVMGIAVIFQDITFAAVKK